VDSFLTERDKSVLLADLGGKTSEAADIFPDFHPGPSALAEPCKNQDHSFSCKETFILGG
jgi:hypothetical protein